MDDKNVLETEAGVGQGLVIKVNEDCQLSSSSTTPPAMPVECNDNDGGLDYNKMGSVFTTKHLNSWEEVVTSNSYGAGDYCCTKCDFTTEYEDEEGYPIDKGDYLMEGYCDECICS